MEQPEVLLSKKHELEQLIRNNEEVYNQALRWSGALPTNMIDPSDIAAHLQILNIELDRINDALHQFSYESLS